MVTFRRFMFVFPCFTHFALCAVLLCSRNRNVESVYALFVHLDLEARMVRGMRFLVIRTARAKHGALDWNGNRQRGIRLFYCLRIFLEEEFLCLFVFNWTEDDLSAPRMRGVVLEYEPTFQLLAPI